MITFEWGKILPGRAVKPYNQQPVVESPSCEVLEFRQGAGFGGMPSWTQFPRLDAGEMELNTLAQIIDQRSWSDGPFLL